jgi:hypothetical protein
MGNGPHFPRKFPTKEHMFPKPPRPEPPRRAIATQVVQQRRAQRAPDVLIVGRPGPAPAPAPADEPASIQGPPVDRQPV